MTWYDKMADATTPMFAKRKAIAEAQLDTFYYDQDWLVENGYIRSVVYYFKKGDSHQEQPGFYHPKAVVEHYFSSATNLTFDYFKQRHSTMLKQTSGRLSETFRINQNSYTESKFF